MAIDTFVEKFSSPFLKTLAASTPKGDPRDDPRHSKPAGIRDEIRLKNWLRRYCQTTRDLALRAEINHLQSLVPRLLNEWRNVQGSATLESLDHEDQSMWRMTKGQWTFLIHLPLVTSWDSLFQTLGKPKPLPTVWKLRFSHGLIFRSRQLLRWLTCRRDPISWPLQTNQT